MKNKNLAQNLLRFGIAFSFIYAAISSFVNPTNWIGFLPEFLTKIISANILLIILSVYELVLGAWILSNKKIYYASIVSSATLFGIIIFNIGALDIIFRDITILLASIALIFMSKAKQNSSKPFP